MDKGMYYMWWGLKLLSDYSYSYALNALCEDPILKAALSLIKYAENKIIEWAQKHNYPWAMIVDDQITTEKAWLASMGNMILPDLPENHYLVVLEKSYDNFLGPHAIYENQNNFLINSGYSSYTPINPGK